jgi:hypothetical protein
VDQLELFAEIFGGNKTLAGAALNYLAETEQNVAYLLNGTYDQRIGAIESLALDAATTFVPVGKVGLTAAKFFGMKAAAAKVIGFAGSVKNLSRNAIDDLIDPYFLQRTHSISGRRSSEIVSEISEKMKQGSYSGPPIDVVKDHEGKLYIIDGHHRVAAAKLSGTPVKINIIRDITQHHSSYMSLEEVINDSFMVEFDKLRVKR